MDHHDRQHDRHHDNRRDGRRDNRRDGGRDGGRDNRRRGTPLSELDPALTDLSRRVIGAAIEVHKELGPGYTRDIYLKALELELGDEEIPFQADHDFEILYGDDSIGSVRTDMFIGDRFLLTVMARSGEVGSDERTALRAHLRAADVELGLIINFGERRLKDGLVRVLNPEKLAELRGETTGEDDDHGGDEDDHEGDDE